MTSGDIVYQKNDCFVVDSLTNTGPANVVPEKIVNWTINFKSNAGDSIDLNLKLAAGMALSPPYGSNNLGLPLDPTKHYDIIFKEH